MTTATESLLGESNAFLEIIEQASRLAPLRKPVLIIGERGPARSSSPTAYIISRIAGIKALSPSTAPP